MGYASVRTAIVGYLTNAGITNLGQVYGYPPKMTPEGDFVKGEAPGHAVGAVIYVHLRNRIEHRVSIGAGTTGNKMAAYTCTLICVLRSKTSETQTAGADNDAFLDSLTAAIRADQNAGDSAVVFQWGEGDMAGAPDIKIETFMPKPIRLETTQVFSLVDVTVFEYVNS